MSEPEIIICRCGQWNRIAPDVNKSGRFTCGRCGKALLSVVADNSRPTPKRERTAFFQQPPAAGQRRRYVVGARWAVAAAIVVLGLSMLSRVSTQTHTPTVNSASTAANKPTTPIAPALPPPPPVRECVTEEFNCLLARNDDIIKRNTEMVRRGQGPLMPLSPIPLPRMEMVPRLAVAEAPAARRGTSDNTPTGFIQKSRRRNSIAPLNIETDSGANYLVKLVSVDDAKDQIMIYVRGGERYSTNVPLGTYIIRCATGHVWYGRDDLFGPSTQFFRLQRKDKPASTEPLMIRFSKQRNQILGHTLSFKGVVGGNLAQEKIDRNEF